MKVHVAVKNTNIRILNTKINQQNEQINSGQFITDQSLQHVSTPHNPLFRLSIPQLSYRDVNTYT